MQSAKNQYVTASRKAHFVILFSAFNEDFFQKTRKFAKTTVTVIAMKKKFIPVLVSLLLAPGLLCQADEHISIIVLPPPPPIQDGGVRPHAPARPVASGYYDFETNQLVLHFNRNLGVCTIEITSTAGEHQVHAFDTSVGSFVTNLSGTPGTYILSIQNETGFETSTYFLIP